jgi:hypothetical protein
MLTSKTERVRQEYEQLKGCNAPLAALVQDLAEFVKVEFRKDVVMTMIFRTQEEQWALYEKTDGPQTTRVSPHMLWQAVDLRDWIYTPKQKQAIGGFLKRHYDATNRLPRLHGGSRTYMLHKIKGGAMHFHVQYVGPFVYVFSERMVIQPLLVHGGD